MRVSLHVLLLASVLFLAAVTTTAQREHGEVGSHPQDSESAGSSAEPPAQAPPASEHDDPLPPRLTPAEKAAIEAADAARDKRAEATNELNKASAARVGRWLRGLKQMARWARPKAAAKMLEAAAAEVELVLLLLVLPLLALLLLLVLTPPPGGAALRERGAVRLPVPRVPDGVRR